MTKHKTRMKNVKYLTKRISKRHTEKDEEEEKKNSSRCEQKQNSYSKLLNMHTNSSFCGCASNQERIYIYLKNF